MRRLQEIQNILQRNKSLLISRFKVKNIDVFGSYVRGEAKEQSDINIMVELYEPIGWDFIELKEYLETILEKRVDLITNEALKPTIRDDIFNEVVYL
jgi:predicted nucleotidyltransferase